MAVDTPPTAVPTPEKQVIIREFAGMASNRDPHDIPPGTSVHQVNVGVGPTGELRVRPGAKVVRFRQGD